MEHTNRSLPSYCPDLAIPRYRDLKQMNLVGTLL